MWGGDVVKVGAHWTRRPQGDKHDASNGRARYEVRKGVQDGQVIWYEVHEKPGGLIGARDVKQ